MSCSQSIAFRQAAAWLRCLLRHSSNRRFTRMLVRRRSTPTMRALHLSAAGEIRMFLSDEFPR